MSVICMLCILVLHITAYYVIVVIAYAHIIMLTLLHMLHAILYMHKEFTRIRETLKAKSRPIYVSRRRGRCCWRLLLYRPLRPSQHQTDRCPWHTNL